MSLHNEKILVVEDDEKIRNFICFKLKQEGYTIKAASTGHAAISFFMSEKFDIVILDLGLPDTEGINLIDKIREWAEVPIIVVSARDQDKEKAAVLDAGADDYLTKPFSATELLARVRVAGRHIRRNMNMEQKIHILAVGELKIDFDKRLVFLEDKEVHCTPLEYSLLSLLFTNMGKVVTTNTIIKEVWGVGYGDDTQALRALMAGLRRKIEKNPGKPRYIVTEIGVGYRLVDE